MTLDRRSFLLIGAAGVAMSTATRVSSQQVRDWSHIKALAFDAFTIFDPRPVFRACEDAFPGHGTELANLWRIRQFEYQWLRALAGRYEDFWQVTRSALGFAARSLKLALPGNTADDLMKGYLSLKAWPDVPAALVELKRSGVRLAILSNATPAILDSGISNSGLKGAFHQVISTDHIKTFKPDARAYQLGVEVLALHKEQIMFAAFAGWDVAGAKWFGYPTYWNNRQSAPAEELAASPDGAGSTLSELVRFLNIGTASE